MHEEAGFLSAIGSTPNDETARLVYADWLDEQGGPSHKPKADFIRLELRMAEKPEQSLNRIRWLNRLQKLAATLDPAWLALVSHPKLEACRAAFRFECPKQWERLTPTGVPTVRFCESCRQHVHYCDTIQDAQAHTERGGCVALSLALVRRPDDIRVPQTGVAEVVQLTLQQVEQLRVAAGLSIRVGSIRSELPVPKPPPQWVPEPESERRGTARPHQRNNRKTRRRRIERENWEDAE